MNEFRVTDDTWTFISIYFRSMFLFNSARFNYLKLQCKTAFIKKKIDKTDFDISF